nr:hypothetical protein [Tanacetum cinerariifolium]
DVSPGVDGPPVMPEDPYAPPSPVYIPYVPEPVYPEYIPPEDDVLAAEEQPLPAAASPTTYSPGYIPESDPDEDPEDNDDEDPKEDPADSFRPQPSTLSFTKEDAERFLAMPIPPPSPLTPLSSPLPQIPSPTLPASPPILPIPLHAASPPLQLLILTAGESSVAAAARPMEGRRADYGFVDSVEAEIRRRRAEDIGYGIRDTWIDPRDVAEEEALTTLERVNTRVIELAAVQDQYHYETGRLVDQEARFPREAWVHSMGLDSAGHLTTALGEIRALQAREQARAGAPEGAGSST